MSLRGFSAVELFKATDPWTTQSLSEVLVNKYGRGALETKSGYQVFLSDKRLTAQQMDDLVFCSASTQGITHVKVSSLTYMSQTSLVLQVPVWRAARVVQHDSCLRQHLITRFCTTGNRWGCSSQKQSQHHKNRSARVLLQSVMDCLKRPNLHCRVDNYKLLPPAAIC